MKYAWTVKVTHYYVSSAYARREAYITEHYQLDRDDGCIIAVPTKRNAERVIEMLRRAPYFLTRGEYIRPKYNICRIKVSARMRLGSFNDACIVLGLNNVCNDDVWALQMSSFSV